MLAGESNDIQYVNLLIVNFKGKLLVILVEFNFQIGCNGDGENVQSFHLLLILTTLPLSLS